MRRAFWIWNLKNTEGGDPTAIAAAAVKAGLTDVFIKVADGSYLFNVVNGKDLVPGAVAALKAAGVRVWGWQYCYGLYPEAEEKIATQRIQSLGLDHFIVDAEVEFKKPGFDQKAAAYLGLLRQHNPGLTLAFSSYRFPKLHMDFPWKPFFTYCDLNMPQVYWLQAHNASAQTQTCFDQFAALAKSMGVKPLPILPAGPAWKENGWRPTVAERDGFEAVAAQNGASLVSYWDWEQCRRDLPELWPAGGIAPPKPITPPMPTADERLVRLELKLQDLDAALSGLAKVLADLKAILK